ncbi:MAG: tyrosine-type recombinase/integrase [Clostridia bacterium]|nr:tyrosine-type recombinase/integrase [Clostridia bacterium]
MGTKRANGEGSFRKRTSNSWEGRIVLDEKRFNVYGKTKSEVRQKVAELQNDYSNGTLVDENNITVGEWMDTWAECYTSGVKSSTLERYMQDIRVHIKPDLGQIQIQDLKLLTVQRFLKRCKDVKGLSEKSLKNIYLVLNKAITRAQKDGLVKKNPCADAEIPMYETPKKEMRPLLDNEVPEFLRLINGHPFEEFYYVAIFTGMRESELIGLTWDCVDLDKGTIHLYRQFKALRGKSKTYTFTTLKNKQERSFSIPPSVVKALKKMKLKQAEWKLYYGTLYHNEENFVFTNEFGHHLATRTVFNRFKSIVKKMGLPEVRLHDLRHTYATLAIQNGVDYKTISNNLGHATVAFTMDVYATVTMTMQKDSASKMESFIQSL